MTRGIDRRSILLGGLPWFFRRSDTTTLSGVSFRVIRRGDNARRYLVIHGDEDTARDVLAAYMRENDGIAHIVTGKTRNVEILGLQIDANRMFSRVGAERSIRNLNPAASPDALLAFLDRERPRLIREVMPPKSGRLFALHNNRDYSVNDELPASDETSILQPNLPRNFFLCTDPADYAILKQSPYNVVLQSKPEPDDGSMSRLCARLRIRYLNLECAIGEYNAQMERVRWADSHLP